MKAKKGPAGFHFACQSPRMLGLCSLLSFSSRNFFGSFSDTILKFPKRKRGSLTSVASLVERSSVYFNRDIVFFNYSPFYPKFTWSPIPKWNWNTNTSGFFLEPQGFFLELGPQCAGTEPLGKLWPDINIRISAAGTYWGFDKSNFLKLKSTPGSMISYKPMVILSHRWIQEYHCWLRL